MAPSWVEKLTPSSPQGSELLQQERDQSNVPIEKLSEFLFTKEALDRQNRILNVLKSEKTFEKSANYFDGRVERFQTALARAKKLQQLTIKHKWSRDDFMVANELISEPGPYGLHASMFLVGSYSFHLLCGCFNPDEVGRLPSVTREHQSSISCSWKKQRSTNTLVVMHRQN